MSTGHKPSSSSGVDPPANNSSAACSTSISSTYLAIPNSGRMARSSSHESFATDVSVLSLSSFTSEIPTRHRYSTYDDKDDDPDSDRCDQSMAKYREDMFEKMLETHILAPGAAARRLNPTSPNQHSTTASGGKFKSDKPSDWKENNNRFRQAISNDKNGGKESTKKIDEMTRSEEELLKKCALDEPRTRGSLYKSFSTSDVMSLQETLALHSSMANELDSMVEMEAANLGSTTTNPSAMKSCASQSWIPGGGIPGDYARNSQSRRRKHLEYLKRLCANSGAIFDEEWNLMCREEEEPGTPEVPSSNVAAGGMSKPKRNKLKGALQPHETRSTRSNSDENLLSWGSKDEQSIGGSRNAFKMKLNFSREIGSRIRDDLLHKLQKHKQQYNQQQNATVTRSDLEKERGRPLTRLERNFIIFHWLQSLDEDSFANA